MVHRLLTYPLGHEAYNEEYDIIEHIARKGYTVIVKENFAIMVTLLILIVHKFYCNPSCILGSTNKLLVILIYYNFFFLNIKIII